MHPREQTDASGLIYLRARYYNPATGRFLTMDPSRQELNPYWYAFGNPIMHTDPSGLNPPGLGPCIDGVFCGDPDDITDPGSGVSQGNDPDGDTSRAGELFGDYRDEGAIQSEIDSTNNSILSDLNSDGYKPLSHAGECAGYAYPAGNGMVVCASPYEILTPSRQENFVDTVHMLAEQMGCSPAEIWLMYHVAQTHLFDVINTNRDDILGYGDAGLLDRLDGITAASFGTVAFLLDLATFGIPEGQIAQSDLGFVGDFSDDLFRRLMASGDELFSAFCSFDGDTLVTTIEGDKPISELELGDLVLAYNEETGELGYFPVLAVWGHSDDNLLSLTIDGETLLTTTDHPFYVEGKGWVAAGDLEPGDRIASADFSRGVVQSVREVDGEQLVYNITVAEAHTYFVGEGEWLVHNDCIALGLTAHLNDFADDVGGKTWNQWTPSADSDNWQYYFMQVMSDEDNTVYFNLTDVNVWPGVQRAASGQGGPTDWELLQIRNNPDWWDRIIWMRDGDIVDNPFQ